MMEPTRLSSVDDCITALETLIECLKKPLSPRDHIEEVGSLQREAIGVSLALLNYFYKEYNAALNESFRKKIESFTSTKQSQ